MDQVVENVLREYEKRSAAETERNQKMDDKEFFNHRDEFLLFVGPATGQLLNLLAKQSHAKTIVEVGSSYGYSTVWLADAARANGGKLITLEAIAEKQAYAKAQIQKAGLAAFVDFRLGDARDSLSKIEVPIDFVLLDLWKDLYIPCFDLFYPKLSPGALVIADNMTYPESAMTHAMNYRKHVRIKRDMQSVLIPVGSGLELSRCTRGLETVLV
jgi:predicted O-methyltransferase YrrM